MIINFVGLFARSDSGEISDESHLADALEGVGHTVRRIPRDEWREFVREEGPVGKYAGIPEDLGADINLIAKWHHFFDGRFVTALKHFSGAHVFYWVWDSVDLGIDWHRQMAKEADLYLSGELGRARQFHEHNIRFYYFQMDVVDGRIPYQYYGRDKAGYKHDVVYLGTYDNQGGRMDLLKAINVHTPIAVYGQNWEKWQEEGFDAHLAVYGQEANAVMAQSKIVLGTSCDPHLFGYWSNRVGRALATRALFLQQYVPGMESFTHDWIEYFSTSEEAVEKIHTMLSGSNYKIRQEYPLELWRSNQKMKDLTILMERYIKEDHGKAWLLP